MYVEMTTTMFSKKIVFYKSLVSCLAILLILLTPFIPFISSLGVLVWFIGFRMIDKKCCIAYDYLLFGRKLEIYQVYKKADVKKMDVLDLTFVKEWGGLACNDQMKAIARCHVGIAAEQELFYLQMTGKNKDRYLLEMNSNFVEKLNAQIRKK